MNRRELFTAPFKRFRENLDEVEKSGEKTSGATKTAVSTMKRSDIINALGSDFSSGRLSQEVMRMGIDPSNLSDEDMIDMIIAEMQKSKPIQEDVQLIKEKESDNTNNS